MKRQSVEKVFSNGGWRSNYKETNPSFWIRTDGIDVNRTRLLLSLSGSKLRGELVKDQNIENCLKGQSNLIKILVDEEFYQYT